MKVPLIDLQAQYLNIKDEIDQAILDLLNKSSFIGGPIVSSFEKHFAEYIGAKYCIGCGNGTDALEIALKALNIGNGDEVIIPAISWISTAECVINVGAKPVFADVLPLYYTIDPSKIEEKLNTKTKAIIPVHIYGLPAEMDQIMAIAERNNLYVIEDCAQAHGALYKDKKVGTFGHLSTFSFYPSKNLGAYGDGGCIITNSKTAADMSRKIANHGQTTKNNHEFAGRNSRLDSIQAAVLNVKLKYLNQWNNNRRQNAFLYTKKLKDTNIQLPTTPIYSHHVYHLFVIQSDNRDKLKKYLEKNKINCAIHYPVSLPFLTFFKNQYDDFPIAYSQMNKVLTLPMYPELSEDKIDLISSVIKKFIENDG